MNGPGSQSGDSGQAFEAALQALVTQIAPDFRERVREDIAQVRAAGGHSLADLERIATDTRQPPALRMLGAWLLARLSGEQALPLLAQLRGDADPQVRGEAVRSLGLTGAAAAVPLLIEALKTDAHAEVRFAAAHALGSLADPAALPLLVGCLQQPDEDERVRGAAAEALALYDDPRATLAALAALRDRATEVRYWAAFALGEIGDPATLAPLREVAASDAAADVRQEAADAVNAILRRGQA